MIAVADTSPLCYVVLVGEIDLLPALFSEVLVPPGVAAELSDHRAPAHSAIGAKSRRPGSGLPIPVRSHCRQRFGASIAVNAKRSLLHSSEVVAQADVSAELVVHFSQELPVVCVHDGERYFDTTEGGCDVQCR